MKKRFNEAKTEDLVRTHLKKSKREYEEKTGQFVCLDEKSPDNPAIKKLLKSASKRGSGVGRPEFIVSFASDSSLIVIECKADVKKHKSETLDQYADYAVDGALLYASYLSKEFDVLAIGVSGENETELEVDTFLQIKGETKARDLGVRELYGFEDCLNLIKKDTRKIEADLEQLKRYSKTLNEKLRDDFGFEEKHRPLVVSSILLALEDDSFRSAYGTKRKPSDIANLLLTAIKEKLENDNIGGSKKETMLATYSFLKTNTKIQSSKNKDGSPNTLFRDLIKEVSDQIRPFTQNYRFHDYLGTFYISFFKYANSDGGLGIVLTPPHITELFSELARVNKDSVVIDNCCGTGGFLIHAMKKMEEEAKGNSEKIEQIHKRQLIGIEENPGMFCLACSNMMLRGDGKSNIYQQDCFEINSDEIKKSKPTVAFLNPPYAKKKNDRNELEFIWNALSFLEPNGICVAIVPQSCAKNSVANQNVRKRLLENHTLKAVMSMPEKLFEDSEKSAVTCVLVFEAHKPHNPNTKTWFGYWKEDGFIKLRPYGRIDYYGEYKDRIKDLWLDSYREQRKLDSFSVLRHVEYKDEWLVEPYLVTDFESLQDSDFENTMKEYSTFLFSNDLVSVASNERYSNEELSIDFKNWQDVLLGGKEGLFTVKGSKTTDKKVLDKEYGEKKGGGYAYVTTQSTNNGVRGFYDFHTEKGNILTIDSAVAGFCSYQPLNFSASDHVEKLIPKKFKLNVYRAMFLATVINKEQYRYSYGRKFNQREIRKTLIKLPFKNESIDWDFIEKYIKGLKYSKNISIDHTEEKKKSN